MVSIIFGLHEPIPVQGRQGMEEAIFYSTDMEIIDKSVMMNPYCTVGVQAEVPGEGNPRGLLSHGQQCPQRECSTQNSQGQSSTIHC